MRNFRISSLLVAAIAMTLAGGMALSPAWADRSKMSRDLQNAIDQAASASQSKQSRVKPRRRRAPAKRQQRDVYLNVIVQTDGLPTPQDLQTARSHGATVVKKFQSINGFLARVPSRRLDKWSDHRRVKRMSPDRAVEGDLHTMSPAVRAAEARAAYGVDGSGVGIAVLDSGVGSHNDLGSRLVQQVRFISNVSDDENGHGTHVAGIIAGNGNESIAENYSRQIIGVAPKARIISVKVLDRFAAGTVSGVISGIDWCIANRDAHNIRVMNLSLGHAPWESYLTDPMCQAVERAWRAGIVVVAAAGNRGRKVSDNPNGGSSYFTINSPGNSPYAITVGATNTKGTLNSADDVMATYSSRGPTVIDNLLKPDLVAPGNKTISLVADATAYARGAWPGNDVQAAAFGGSGAVRYYTLSGTSMATPVVAGAAALLLERDPTLTPNDVKARLVLTANRNVRNSDGALADALTRGAGQLNVHAALQCRAKVAAGTHAWSPKVVRGVVTGLFYLRTQPLWGGVALWTDATKLWSGSDLLSPSAEDNLSNSNMAWADGRNLYGGNMAWADSALYGDSALAGQNMAWADSNWEIAGSNMAWADNTPKADNIMVDGE